MSSGPGIEPYAVRLVLEGEVPDPGRAIGDLIADIAQRCERHGATLIGHIKCHARSASGSFHCSLTSVRTGVDCAGDTAALLGPAGRIDVDLAILVPGLDRRTIDALAREAMESASASGSFDCTPTSNCH